jgi:hypothetical protein
MAKHFSTTDDHFTNHAVEAGDGPPELNADDIGDTNSISSHSALINSPEKPRESPTKPGGSPAERPARGPAERPVGLPVGMVAGDAQGLASGSPLGQSHGAGMDSHSDWSLWWGTFQAVPGARLHVWRCSAHGLNVGDVLLVMTVDDARRMRLDDYPTALNYFSNRFGPGRYRLTPRSDQGGKLPGTQSLTAVIDEDTSMQVTMTPAASLTSSIPALATPSSGDRETAIQIERMRLQSDMERERETRRERQREIREERRREKEVERERRRDEDRKRREEEDRRRSDRELQMHTLMVQMLKEVAGGRANTGNDTLMAAILAKVGQPDPLVLKLLDTHGKREEMTDFFKVQAESMRMASTLQTDSLKQVMVASQEVQSQLMRQAAEVASQRDGGDGWSGIGSVLSATASIVAALRSGNVSGSPLIPQPIIHDIISERQPTINPPRPKPKLVSPPITVPSSRPSDPVGDSLRQVRNVHRGGQTENINSLKQIVAGLSPALSQAIRTGDVTAIQNEVMPTVQADPTLAEWLSQPEVGDWLTSYLQRLREELTGGVDKPTIVTSPTITSQVTHDDLIV